jgi:hypothetical protein
MCCYADEDSMSPLWKGQRFPEGIPDPGFKVAALKAASGD